MVYAVRVSDSKSGLEKIVTVEARTPEEAYQRIERTGYRIVRVTPAQPGAAAGVVMNPPAAAPDEPEPRETPGEAQRRRQLEARALMIHSHNWLTLWPILAGIGSILWGVFQWLEGNNLQALISAVIGVVVSAVGALRRWTRDQGPWR